VIINIAKLNQELKSEAAGRAASESAAQKRGFAGIDGIDGKT